MPWALQLRPDTLRAFDPAVRNPIIPPATSELYSRTHSSTRPSSAIASSVSHLYQSDRADKQVGRKDAF